MSNSRIDSGALECSVNNSDSSLDLALEEEKATLPLGSDRNYFVEWDGNNDPLNPRSMPVFRKWLIISVIAWGSLLVYATHVLLLSD